MSINPIDENATPPKTTGSLEELFRHHLGETAVVPPSPLLWDQIDNSLLVQQNATYQRRLAATRWVAAASLLLAALAGTGWWTQRGASLGGADTATYNSPAVAQRAASAIPNALPSGPNNRRGNSLSGETASITDPTSLAAASPGSGNHRASMPKGWHSATQTVVANLTAPKARFGQVPALSSSESGSANRRRMENRAADSANSASSFVGNAPPDNAVLADDQPFSAGATATSNEYLASEATAAVTHGSAGAIPRQIGLLAARLASLAVPAPAALPEVLAAVPVATGPETASDAHKWHYSVHYAAGVFNPNINFSRAGSALAYSYNTALGTGSPKLTEQAAAQYRENLRPGFAQRLALLATRHLTGHWSLKTGAEFGQAQAKSASAPAYVGEQLLDLGQLNTGPLYTTYFHYTTAGIPVEMHYANPVKRGWSLYGHLGGVVSALLRVRSEVGGDPEATRTYSIASSGSPYRRVLGSLRGGAGAQFRTATGRWALTLGPVAEIGFMTLNAHPAQSYFAQSRGYSFGVEAGMEFGRQH